MISLFIRLDDMTPTCFVLSYILFNLISASGILVILPDKVKISVITRVKDGL